MTPELGGRLALVTGAHGKLGPCGSVRWQGPERVSWASTSSPASSRRTAVEVVDVTDREALVDLRDRIGAPDILVNNAGIDQPPSPVGVSYGIEDVPLADFARVLEVDVEFARVFNVSQVFGSAMRDAGRGSIVNIGSLYASLAPEPAFYAHMGLSPRFLKPRRIRRVQGRPPHAHALFRAAVGAA